MRFDSMDTKDISFERPSFKEHLGMLNHGFEKPMTTLDGVFQHTDPSIDVTLAHFIGTENLEAVAAMRPTVRDSIREMLYGTEQNTTKTSSLIKISEMKINPDHQLQNHRQHAGYAAEVISTTKENLNARLNNTGIITRRADDMPDKYPHNDQFVDKVRMNADGEIIEKIQTKFVGKSGREWVSKMMSKKFDKYFNGDVDKIECPKNYYDEAMKAIADDQTKLLKQLDHVRTDGKTDIVVKLEGRINKLNSLEMMIEQSTVTSDEAMFASIHPRLYATKLFTREVVRVSNAEGLRSGVMAAGLNFTVSTVENMKSLIDGKITSQEMVTDVIEDTAATGALGYGTVFVSSAISQAMSASSHALIHSIGESCLPAAAVTFTVESYDDISDYLEGKIDGLGLAHNLGNNVSMIAGGIGGAKIGAAIGTVAGPAGTAVGGIVGGMVGCAVASEMFETAVSLGIEGASVLADKAKEFASAAVEAVTEGIPDAVDNVKNAFNSFFKSTSIIFSF